VVRSRLVRRLLIVAAAALIPAVAGCEAGDNAPTLQFHYPTVGSGTNVQGMSIANVFVLGGQGTTALPAGGSASLFLALVNNGSPQRLLSIQAPGTASSVTVTGGTIRLAASGSALLTGPRPAAVLTGLTRRLRSGTIITIVLTFSKIGAVSLRVPVLAQASEYSTFSPPAPTPTAAPKTRKHPATPGTTVTPGTTGAATATPSPSAS
jgi:copper(I)-binding protein